MGIPANVDFLAILCDLNRWGWRDLRIEVICGFSSGYVAQLKAGTIRQMSYQRGARLYNLWDEEGDRRISQGLHVETPAPL